MRLLGVWVSYTLHANQSQKHLIYPTCGDISARDVSTCRVITSICHDSICVCVWERESVCVCVLRVMSLYVETPYLHVMTLYVCVRMCVCVKERERVNVLRDTHTLSLSLSHTHTHTYTHTHQRLPQAVPTTWIAGHLEDVGWVITKDACEDTHTHTHM